MNNKLEIYKKKLIYRAGYRGTKEMDILLSTFVNKYIDTFDESLLNELEKFLDFEDEIILNFYQKNIIEKKLTKIEFLKFLKISKFNGGEVGSNPRTSCPVAGFQDQCFQPLSHLSLKLNKVP